MKKANPENTKITIEKEKNADDFERLRFVAKALAAGKCPSFTTVIHAEQTRSGTRLIATDGRRLHAALIRMKIPNGNYVPKGSVEKVTLEKCDEEIRYPSWKNVLPESAKPKCEIDLAGTNCGRTVAGAEKLSIANSAVSKKTGRVVNLKFLSDLPEKVWKVYADSTNTKPIMLKDSADGDSQFAVISPLAA